MKCIVGYLVTSDAYKIKWAAQEQLQGTRSAVGSLAGRADDVSGVYGGWCLESSLVDVNVSSESRCSLSQIWLLFNFSVGLQCIF